jgi:ABC-type lipoprotein release transport system permease subunit
MASIGVGSGLLISLWTTQALEGLLFGTRPQDPTTFVAAAVVLSVVATLACYLPARRASSVAPLEILRAE